MCDVGCDVAIATVEYPYIAETAVIAGSTVIVIGEHQAHCCARVVLTHWNLVMNHTTPGVGRKVVNSPDRGAVQAENPVTVGEITILVKADALYFALRRALNQFEHRSRDDGGGLIGLTPGIVGQDEGRAVIGYRYIASFILGGVRTR